MYMIMAMLLAAQLSCGIPEDSEDSLIGTWENSEGVTWCFTRDTLYVNDSIEGDVYPLWRLDHGDVIYTDIFGTASCDFGVSSVTDSCLTMRCLVDGTVWDFRRKK